MYNCRRRARLYICNIVLQLVILFVVVIINCFFSLYHLSLYTYIYIYMIFQVNVDRLIYNGMCMVIKMAFLIDCWSFSCWSFFMQSMGIDAKC